MENGLRDSWKMNLKGLATGIGSLPHPDVEAALDLIFKYVPNIPFWPQLPKRDVREGMIAQFTEGLPGIKITKDGVYFDEKDRDKELERFYESIITKDTSDFKISEDFALGLWKFYQRLEKSDLNEVEFIKCQVTGPFTFAASINDKQGRPILHDEILMQVVLKGLSMKALWQIDLFRKFGKRIILFLDEPYLGAFGSAFTPINRENVIRDLRELISSVKSPDVLVGVHCCGNTDWSIFTEVEQIDIISFDAFGFQDKFVLYADNLKDFLNRDGIICWGAVPTQEFTGDETAELLVAKIKDGINILAKKGVDRDLLLNNLLVSPACGLGTLDIDKSDRIFNLLSDVSTLIRKTL